MIIDPFDDEFFMKQALNEAEKAFKLDEVPVGAVIVSNNKIIFLYVTTIKYYDKDKKKASDKIACFNLKIYFN